MGEQRIIIKGVETKDGQVQQQDIISVGDVTNATGITVSRGEQSLVQSKQPLSEVDILFHDIYQLIDQRAEDPNVDREEIREVVSHIHQEVLESQYSASPSAAKLTRWLANLQEMAPDVCERTAASLLNPALHMTDLAVKITNQVFGPADREGP
ncbi:MAG: hypothetical protein Fur005_23210 [Roseiflexaceae bacterium]